MNDLFNILIFSKDYNQGVIIQDYINLKSATIIQYTIKGRFMSR